MTQDFAPTATAPHPRGVTNRVLADLDPEVHRAISAELGRQQNTLEMIASENFAPLAVMQAQGSVLTNKYAEGYPGRRYYGGCENVDVIEQLAIDRLNALFGSSIRQRAAALGCAGQRRCDGGTAAARRHDSRSRTRPRRTPHPRHEAELLRQAVRRRPPTTSARTTISSTWPRWSASPTSTVPS